MDVANSSITFGKLSCRITSAVEQRNTAVCSAHKFQICPSKGRVYPCFLVELMVADHKHLELTAQDISPICGYHAIQIKDMTLCKLEIFLPP